MAFLNEQGLATLWGKVKDQVADAKAYTDEKVGGIVIPEQVQSDWNVNEISSPAFIKNRTHYEGNGTVLVDYTDDNWHGNDVISKTFQSDEIILPENFILGNTYTVIIDGVHYEAVAFETVDSMMGESVYALGNGSIAFTSGGDSTLPFYIDKYKTFTSLNTIYLRNDNSSTYHSVSVVKGLATKQLDEKFIPSSIARSSEVEEMVNKKPGRLIEGEELTYTDYSNGGVETIATAETGAEIFNDLNNNAAIGKYSHAEGERTVAINTCAHAEGYYTMAAGSASHAEGIMTRASGQGSHAEGEGTVAVYTSYGPQHVQGKYNVIDTSGIYAHIVGGGSEDEPRNIHTVDYDGIGWYPNIYLGGNDEHTATIKGFYVHNSTTSLPAVVNGAILIAYDE